MNESASFEKNLKNPNCGVAVDFSDPSDCLIIAFGGFKGALHMPPFEFFTTLEGIPCKKIFVRDLRQCWYHQGIPDYGNSIPELQRGLAKLIKKSGAKRVIALGTSSGGYAAILFGLLLQLDEVHAFSPKTNINPLTRLLHNDLKFWRRGLVLLFSPQAQRNLFDIKSVLKKQRHPINLHLYYGAHYRRDVNHSQRIAHDPRVHLHPYPYDKHTVAAHLRDQGLLSQILRKAIQSKDSDISPEIPA